MKYYLHDTNSFEDEKVTELFMAFGYEGLGLFYTILERLGKQEKPVKTTVLKKQLLVGKRLDKCWSFMESLQLISSYNGETFNNNLLKFSEKYQVLKEKNRERVSQWRDKQADENPVTHYEHVRNSPKVNISKVKEGKPSTSLRSVREAKEPEQFTDFWLVYPRKESKASALKAFAKLSPDEQAGAAQAAREWFGRRSDWIGADGTDFRPHPDTWLNKKRWQDLTEITITQTPTPQSHGNPTATAQHAGNYQHTRTAPSKFEFTDTDSLRAANLLLKSIGL